MNGVIEQHPGVKDGSMEIATPHHASGASFAGHRAGRSAADGIVAAIEERIREQHLTPGHRIGTKQELTAEFGVAPATLSEALRLLRARGTVEVRPGPGGGTFVADQSPMIRLAHVVLALRDEGASFNDVLEVIDALDEAVVRDAAEFRTRRDLIELDALMTKLAESWDNPAKSMSCNWQLHRRIAEITPNVILRAFYQNMIDYVELEDYRAAPDETALPPHDGHRLQVHRDLVEAIRAQDQDFVSMAVRRHRSN